MEYLMTDPWRRWRREGQDGQGRSATSLGVRYHGGDAYGVSRFDPIQQEWPYSCWFCVGTLRLNVPRIHLQENTTIN